MTTFTLRGVRALDRSGSFTDPVDVAVVDGAVARIGRALPSSDAVSHDCSGLWLLPGVFDCHAHIAISTFDTMDALRTPITNWTLRAARNLATTLRAGVTFVRDAGGADAGIRDGVAEGLVPGPTLQVANVVLSQTGGHIDGFLAGPGLEISAEYVLPEYPGRPPCVADGPEGVRAAVRKILRSGADWIKLCATGGVLSEHTDPLAPEFTPEELGVAVAEAARRGRGVMAHAFGGEGLDNAIAAGVRSIEHGLFLSEAQAAGMAARGVWLVPTLLIVREALALAASGQLPPYAQRKAAVLEGTIGDAVAIAKAHGVPIALGTDASRTLHGRNLEELPLLHEAGLSVEETLLAATLGGAELCGVADRYGRLEPGYVFDAILLDEDPGDLRVFARPGGVTGVFKDGRPVVAHPRLADAARVRPAASRR